MQPNHINPFDEAFGELLRQSASPISRRSMLGKGVNLLLGFVGVAGVGSIPLLADVPGWGRQATSDATAASNQLGNYAPPPHFDSTCHNLHGVLCSGNCDPAAAGASDCVQSDTTQRLAAWVGCCKRTNDHKYQCYTMADVVCATRPTNWLVRCPGNRPTGRIWFGGQQGQRSYVCTIPAAVGKGYTRAHACARNCTPTLYPNSWAC
jgi:hypothetical protein